MTADDFRTLLFLGVFALIGLLALVVALRKPWWAVVGTLFSLTLVPYWVGVSVSFMHVSVHIIAALVAIVAMINHERRKWQTSWADWTLLGLLALSTGAYFLGLTNAAQLYGLVLWMIFYLFARLAGAVFGVQRVISVFAVAAAVVAVAILIEQLTGRNFFIEFFRMSNPTYTAWGRLQYRGGVLRAEGPFGHSIAAGCVLAVGAIMALGSRFRTPVRLALVALTGGAILTTISRTGILTAVLGIVLLIFFGRVQLSRAARVGTLSVLALGALVFRTYVTDILSASGAEAANSASYRVWLLELLPSGSPIGLASSYYRSTTGETTFGDFQSIDSQVLLFLLTQGWVLTLIVIALLLGAIGHVIARRGGPAMVSVVALIPALFTVALITQYQLVFWLAAGLAVTEAVEARTAATANPPDHPPTESTPKNKELTTC